MNKEDDAQAFVSEIESVIETRFSVEKDRLATKEDLLATKEDLTREISSFESGNERAKIGHDKMDVYFLDGPDSCYAFNYILIA